MQRELTIKILTIGILSLLVLMPLEMIKKKISDRDIFRSQAAHSVAKSWTKEQTVLTPILVLPYTYISNPSSDITQNDQRIEKYYILSPDEVSVTGTVNTDTLMRGIYKIPVYESFLQMNGRFTAAAVDKAHKEISGFKGSAVIGEPFLAIHVSDPRGINNTPTLRWKNESIKFEPGANIKQLSNGIHARIPELDISANTGWDFNLDLNLRGMDELSFVPAGSLVNIDLKSSWAHPEFIGSFLPAQREVTNEGFNAQWQITRFSSGIEDSLQQCEQKDCSSLLQNKLGVSLINSVDLYLQSERSVKYGILFFAMLMGAILVFGVLSIVMIFTRRINWYEVGEHIGRQTSEHNNLTTFED